MSYQAENEIQDIAYFISLDNEERAKTFTKELIEHFTRSISMFPEI